VKMYAWRRVFSPNKGGGDYGEPERWHTVGIDFDSEGDDLDDGENDGDYDDLLFPSFHAAAAWLNQSKFKDEWQELREHWYGPNAPGYHETTFLARADVVDHDAEMAAIIATGVLDG
jgi:hypothetical protein